jgi:hypothetical protein
MRAKKKPAGIKLQYFFQYGDKKKQQNNQRTKLSIYILDIIESESTTSPQRLRIDHQIV